MKLFIYIISNILQLQIRELRHHPYDHLEELPGWVCVRSPLVYRKCIQVTHNPLEEDAESYAVIQMNTFSSVTHKKLDE